MKKEGSMLNIKSRAEKHFRGKHITVMGLGLLGRGVGDVMYLAECGAYITVTDLKSEEELRLSLDKLINFKNINYVLGRHNLSDFRGKDLIIKAAGVPDDSIYLAEARSSGAEVRMSADLFAELSGIPIIGVTGTRGKTTVSYMIHEVLKSAGVRTLLGGNILGVSTLGMLSSAEDIDVAVLELDSWQLQGFGDSKISPHIAVITTFFEDHLSYYHHDMKRYFEDKAKIFLYQSPADTLIVGAQAVPTLKKFYPEVMDRSIVVSELDILDWKLSIPGIHIRYNAACARAALLTYGISESVIRNTLAEFRGVTGRLELVREKDGIQIYNDTMAVIPEATCAGLNALSGVPITLIMGGKDKGNDVNRLIQTISDTKAQVVLLPGSGSDAIAPYISNVVRALSLEEAVKIALDITPQGGAILFSPAFSSIGFFANVYDRGNKFMEVINSL